MRQSSAATAEKRITAQASAEQIVKCRVCRMALVDGARWCTRCGVNTMSHVHGRLASPLRRLIAAAIDFAIPATAFAATWSLGDGGEIFELLLLAYAASSLVLFSTGSTPGKRLLGIRVIDEDGFPATLGRMVVREWIGKTISTGLVGLGALGIIFDRERRALHDRMAHTYVIG